MATTGKLRKIAPSAARVKMHDLVLDGTPLEYGIFITGQPYILNLDTDVYYYLERSHLLPPTANPNTPNP